ncbi:MAG: hypothetical protein ACK4PC_03490 [Sphingopyxis sp.]
MAAGDGARNEVCGDVCADLAASERHGIARRIGAIVARFQREAQEGQVSIASVELCLVVLADDVRAGIHGGERQ